LEFPEVQEAMKSISSGWLEPNLVEKVGSNPRLLDALKNPQFTKALEVIQQEPNRAKGIFNAYPDIAELLREFCQLLGSHFIEHEKDRNVSSEQPLLVEEVTKNKNEADDEQRRVDKLLADPCIRDALTDPDMKRVMQECSVPGRMQSFMADPVYGPKLRMFIDAGLLQVQR